MTIRNIRLGERSVSVKVLGSEETNPIVYFNHIPDIPGEGLSLCEVLAANHQIFYVEGLENTEDIHENTSANLTQRAAKTIQALALSEPPLLVGHLSGGHLAAEVARLHPDLAKGVYLLHTPMDFLMASDTVSTEQTQRYWAFIRPFVIDDSSDKKQRSLRTFWEKESWWSSHKKEYEPYLKDEKFVRKVADYYQANFTVENGKIKPKEAFIGQKIAVPVLFLYDHKRTTAQLIDHHFLSAYAENHRIYPFSLKSLKPWLSDARDIDVVKSIRTFYKDIRVAADYALHQQNSLLLTHKISTNQKLRVCVVGAGAAGLSCALALREAGHEVTVIEKQMQSGIAPGHASSVDLSGGESVDPAFGAIIPALYPNTMQLLDRLEVGYETLSYANRSATYFTEDRIHTWDGEASYPFSRKVFLESDKLRGILRSSEMNHGDYFSLEDVLNGSDHRFSTNFWYHYFFGRMIFFFGGHPLRYYLQYPLSILNLTANLDLSSNKICRITKGSAFYMRKFQQYVESKGVTVLTQANGRLIERPDAGPLKVAIEQNGNIQSESFDQVVMGTLPDVSLRFLGGHAKPKEAGILSSFSISDDEVILHKDESMMPPDKSIWRYMNVMVPDLNATGYDHPCVVTKLFRSNHDQQTPTFVTHAYGLDLPIKDGVTSTHRHVHINVETVRLRKQVESIQGNGSIWYCGSWLRGLNFHEDAIVSGLRVATQLTKNKNLMVSPTVSQKEKAGPDETFKDVLTDRAATYQSRKAFIYQDIKGRESEYHTFSQLYEEAQNFGYHLIHKLKLKKGDHVVLCYLNASDHYVAFLGCTLAGVIPAIVTPLNPKQVKNDIDVFGKVIASCGAKIVLTDSKYYAYYKAGRAASPSTYGKKIAVSWYRSDKFSSQKPPEFEFSPVSKQDVAYLQYTSGSIGVPKGIMITHEQLMAQLDMLDDRLRPTPSDFVVSWVPHFHNIGLVGIFLLSIYTGATTVNIPPLVFLANPRIYLDALSHYQAAFTVMPSFGLRHILKKTGDFEPGKWNFSRLKTFALGGERIDPNVLEEFVQTFKNSGLDVGVMAPGYGLGEHVTIVSLGGRRFYKVDRMALTHQNKIKPGTHTLVGCGEPVKGVTVKIVNPETCKLVDEDQVGEVWASSTSKATGYIQLDEVNEEVFNARIVGDDSSEGYLRTGDLGFVREGEIYICGRIKNMINVRGANLYPTDIEEALVPLPNVARSIAFAAQTTEKEEGIAIAVEVGPGFQQKKEKIAESLIQPISEKTLMSVGVAPEAVFLIKGGSLPLSFLGKIQRKKFQNLWERGEIKPIYTSEGDAYNDTHQLIDLKELELFDFSSVEKVIVRKINEVARVWVDPKAPLFDQITLESIQVVQLVHELSKTFDMDLSPTILEMYNTVEEVALYVQHAPEYHPLPSNVLAFNLEKKGKTSSPVFMIHPARGGVHCYLELARETDAFFYAISDNGRYASVEEKATEYCQLIREVQPHGPYTLGGYSFGGTLSLNMASILEKEGEEVQQVLLIDEGHATSEDFPDAFNEEINVLQFLELIASDYIAANEIEALRTLHKEKDLSLDEVGNEIKDPKIREQIFFEKKAYLSNIRILKEWSPDFSYSGPVTLLKTKHVINQLEERYTKVIPIEGDHLSIIRQPHVREVAKIFSTLLHRENLPKKERVLDLYKLVVNEKPAHKAVSIKAVP